MFIGCIQLIIIMLLTFIFDAFTIANECQEACSIDYCLKYVSLNKNCTKLIRDQCNCCTVCLRNENDICGGRFNVYGICEQDLICYKTNKIEHKGICVKG